LSGTGTVANGQVQLRNIGLNGTPPAPFTPDDIMLSLATPDTLHMAAHEEFVDPSDPRGPTDMDADLQRAP